MLKLVIRLSALSLGLSYATPTTPCQKNQQTQLTSLNERMNQMIEALYSSSIFSKPKTTSTENSSETVNGPEYASNTISYELPFYSSAYPVPIVASPTPQVIYVSPQPPLGLAYAPPSPPYSPVTLPSPTIPTSYYPIPNPSSEHSHPVPTQYPWPQAHSYETYTKPPQVPSAQYSPVPIPLPPVAPLPVPSPPVTPVPPLPPLPYPPVYSYHTTTPTYEYKYSYPEYPPPTVTSYPTRNFQSNLSQPPYTQISEHPQPMPFYGYPGMPIPPPAYPPSSHSTYTRYSELIPISPPYV